MKLYARDYNELTPEEYNEWQSVRNNEIVSKIGDLEIRRNLFRSYPKAARHFTSLFPNNYLDPVDIEKSESLEYQLIQFLELISSKDKRTKERDILNFINHDRAFFIIGSLLKKYFSFGHHDAFLFPEFGICNSYKADYLLVGKNSGGWHFVFVELESPFGRVTNGDGEISGGGAISKGIKQVKQWDKLFQIRYSCLKGTFDKSIHRDKKLPDEFFELDMSRINYVVIAGKRENFEDATYRLRRELLKNNRILLLHYDNLYDASEELIGQNSY